MSHPNNSNWTLTNQRTGEVIPLTGTHATIGRQAGNTIVLADAQASRHHATISWQGGLYVVQDAGSSNGTYLDGERITSPKPLQPGAVLQIGESTFVVGVAPAGRAGQQKPVAQPRPGASLPQTPAARPRSRGATAGIILGAVAIVGLIIVVAALLLSGSGDAPPAIAPSPPVTARPLAAVETATEPAATSTLPPAATGSPTPWPTDEPSATVTQTSPPPTAAPSSPTPGLTPNPTATQTQSEPAPTLLAPQEEDAQSLHGQVTFRWAYPKPLAADQAFQVLIWKEGRSHDGAAQLLTATEQTIDLDVVLPQRGGTGEYFWTVVVRQKGTEKLLSPEPGPWRLVYVGSEAPPPPPPNKCAGVCEKCTSWADWDPLCEECGCATPEAYHGFKRFEAAGSNGIK